MAERKSFLLRIDPAVLEALQRWATADLRSVNAQVEFVLRRALAAEGRLRPGGPEAAPGAEPGAGVPPPEDDPPGGP